MSYLKSYGEQITNVFQLIGNQSTVTTYVESSAGIMAGGRTGRLFRYYE